MIWLVLLSLFFISTCVDTKNITLKMYTTLDGDIVPETQHFVANPMQMSHPVFPLQQPVSPVNVLIVRDMYHWITACHWTGRRLFASVMNRILPELFEKVLPIRGISSIRGRTDCHGIQFHLDTTCDTLLLPKISIITRWCCLY